MYTSKRMCVKRSPHTLCNVPSGKRLDPTFKTLSNTLHLCSWQTHVVQSHGMQASSQITILHVFNGDHQPGDHQPGDNQPGDNQPGGHQPGDNQNRDHQTGNHQTGNHQTGDHQPGDHPLTFQHGATLMSDSQHVSQSFSKEVNFPYKRV